MLRVSTRIKLHNINIPVNNATHRKIEYNRRYKENNRNEIIPGSPVHEFLLVLLGWSNTTKTIYTPTNKQTNKQTNKHTNKQTNKQTNKHTHQQQQKKFMVGKLLFEFAIYR